MSVFLSSNFSVTILTFLYLLSYLFVWTEEHPLKEHMCKFKIDKITCSNKCKTMYYVTKVKPSV